jgi:hypothetical protein
MLKRWTVGIAGLLALAVIFSGAAQAQTTAPKKTTATAAKKAPAVQQIAGTGVITSVDATHLMLTHKVNGKDTPMTLVLTPETKKEGDLAPGNRVSVRYHMENNDMVATSVRAQAATAAKSKTTGTKAKKS